MYYSEIEKLVDRTGGSVYKLVVVASKRALELAEGSPRLVEGFNSSTKPSTVALEEIAEGVVKIKG